MIKKIKTYIAKKKNEKEQKVQLIKAKEYYHILKCGATFLRYIRDDLAKQKKDQLNRTQRRRIEKQLTQKGEFNAEVVDFYSKRIDDVLKQIKEREAK